MNHPNQILSEQIEQLVRQHVEATRRAAAAALERAFWTETEGREQTQAKTAGRAKRSSGNRRSPAELLALRERLHEAVCAQPGETMLVLAPTLGKTPRALHHAMMALKQAGRVRSVGQRHHTRYYPSVARPDANAG